MNTHLPGRCANLVMRRGDASLVRVAADDTVDGLFMSRCWTEKIMRHTRDDDELKLLNAAPVSCLKTSGACVVWVNNARGSGTSSRPDAVRHGAPG